MEQKISNDSRPGAENEKIKRVRDILLGRKFQELDNRFKEIQNQFTAKFGEASEEIAELRKNVLSFVDETVKKLTHDIQAIEKQSNDADDKLKQSIDSLKLEIKDLVTSTEKGFEEFNTVLDAHRSETEQKIRESSENLKDEINKEMANVKQRMVARTNLAALLSELSAQINDENDTK